MKIDWEEISYDLSRKWISFTYLWRRPYYKLRLLFKISKTVYYGAWEMVEPMLEVPFILFCEFYEESDVANHLVLDPEEESNKHGEKDFAIYQNKCYDEMDYLYKWYKEIRHQRQEELDYLLDLWSDRHVNWWGSCGDSKDNKRGYKQYYSTSDRYERYIFKMLAEEEKKFEQEKEDALMLLIKLRNRLWD